MGRLTNRDAWHGLPSNVLLALESWLVDEDFDLTFRGWFADGRSGEPVARVARRLTKDSDQFVLKFFTADGEQRINRIQQAWEASSTAFEHLAEPLRWSIPLGDWRAVLLQVAGGGLATVKPLTDLHRLKKFPNYCGAVVRSVVDEWNQGRVDTSEKKNTAGSVLGDMLARRLDTIETWVRTAGVALDNSRWTGIEGQTTDRVDPFTLVSGPYSDLKIDLLFVGNAHGDLSGRNVLVPTKTSADVPTSASVNIGSYTLIDYDRFDKKAPMARDPMHLLVALALDRLDDSGPRTWPDLSEALVHPLTTSTSHHSLLRRVSAEIGKASLPDHRKGLGDEWRQQCLLSLVGAGLLHLGRDLRTDDPDEAKKWCFDLASVAAAAYLHEIRVGQRIELVASSTSGGIRPASGQMVNRTNDQDALRTRLMSGLRGVTVLRGSRGIGKTKLVDVVLGDLEEGPDADTALRIHRHDVKASTQLDTTALVDHLEGRSDNRLRAGGSSLVRLEDILRLLGDSRVVVVVDSAENLLESGTSKLIDPDLDQALELLATARGHRVMVLLVSQQEPVSPNGGTWPIAETPIHLGRLDEVDFLTYLDRLEHSSGWNPRNLPESTLQTLYDQMQGNPRLGELAHAVVVVTESGPDLRSLADNLRWLDRRAVPTHLTRLLVTGLSSIRRRVLEALAAFDTPVPAAAVIGMVFDEPPAEVSRALSMLVDQQIVYRVGQDQHFLPAEDGRMVLNCISDEDARSDLHLLAADNLTFFKDTNPRSVSDLRVHFAELNALLRADEYRAAYEMIEFVEVVLRTWNCSHLLLEQRKKIEERIDDEHTKMANYNALADIYLSAGQYPEADDAFGKAFAIALDHQDDVSKMKIHTNLAGLYLEQYDTDSALGYYEFGATQARRLRDPEVLMGALEGMAVCHRRQGDYDKAIQCAKTALESAESPDHPDTDVARDSARSWTVVIALKIARWFGELGARVEAGHFIEVAGSASDEMPSERMRAAYLEGRADLELDRKNPVLTEALAREAMDLALRQGDRVILLQARITLCFLYLRSDRIGHAWTEIKLARPYRRRHRSLIVLALLALTARKMGDHQAAGVLFQQLLTESTYRVEHDPRDFTAHDFRGYAICGLRVDTAGDLGEAVAAFRTARNLTPPTPALVSRLRIMVELLDRPDRVRPILDVL